MGWHFSESLLAEKNGTSHEIGEDCPSGHMADFGQGEGSFHDVCQERKSFTTERQITPKFKQRIYYDNYIINKNRHQIFILPLTSH